MPNRKRYCSALLCGILAAGSILTSCGGGKAGQELGEKGAETVENRETTEYTGVMTVNTVADLRKVNDPSVEQVTTRGHRFAGDGCGFIYCRDSVNRSAREDGGRIIVGDDGTRWRAVYSGPLSAKLYGAVGDGKSDDTEALKNWLGALSSGDSGYAPAGTYLFTEPLELPEKDNISLCGDGPQQTLFRYAGEKDDCDLILCGSESTVLYGWDLRDLNIDSGTRMKSGTALHLINLKHTCNLRNVSFGSLSGKRGGNLYNAVWFDRCSLTDYVGFEIMAQNEAIMISGTANDDSAADILIDQGTVVGARIGIHCGGGFGGLYIRQVLLYGCGEIGYLQDNTLAARGNREIFLSDQCVLDACHSCCACVDDPKSNQCTLQFNAFISGAGWLAPATPGIGLYVKSLPYGRISIGSGHIKHCASDGVVFADRTVYAAISPTVYIVGNGGMGIRSGFGKGNIMGDPVFLSNTGGDKNY